VPFACLDEREKSVCRKKGRRNVGCGSDHSTATFFTSLIDDVRIYSHPPSP
jgi:hypothetical protein